MCLSLCNPLSPMAPEAMKKTRRSQSWVLGDLEPAPLYLSLRLGFGSGLLMTAGIWSVP